MRAKRKCGTAGKTATGGCRGQHRKEEIAAGKVSSPLLIFGSSGFVRQQRLSITASNSLLLPLL